MCTAVLIGWAPATPNLPSHLGSYKRALLVSQDRRHPFVTPCPERTLLAILFLVVATHWRNFVVWFLVKSVKKCPRYLEHKLLTWEALQCFIFILVFNSELNLCHALVPHVSVPGFCSNKLLFRPLFRNVGERWVQFLISGNPKLFSGIVSFSGSAFGLISVNIPEFSLFQKPTL